MKHLLLFILAVATITTGKAQQINAESDLNKPTVIIGKDWSINTMYIDQSTGSEFEKSEFIQEFEKTIHLSFTSETDKYEVIYKNKDENIIFVFKVASESVDEPDNNTLKAYYINNFDTINIYFENGLRPNLSITEVLKITDKETIKEYDNTYAMLISGRTNTITIQNDEYDIDLIFNEGLFSSIFIKSKKNPLL